MKNASVNVAVLSSSGFACEAEILASQLGVPLVQNISGKSSLPKAEKTLYLSYFEQGLGLFEQGAKAKPVIVDFHAQAQKRRQGTEILAKAVGKGSRPLSVLDATAGLGRDSFMLAQRGYQLTAMERNPFVAALLSDGVARLQDSELAALHFKFLEGCSVSAMQRAVSGSVAQIEQEKWDVVVLDPMFPSSNKSALVKKDMQLFHQLVGFDDNGSSLFDAAIDCAKHRVVVKRGLKSPPLVNHIAPSFQVKGKSIRCDVYTKQKLP